MEQKIVPLFFELAICPHTVSGVLLYAKTDEEIVVDHVYQISGRIFVKTLDLNKDFSEIRESLDKIVIYSAIYGSKYMWMLQK